MAGERGIDPVRHAQLRKEYGFDQPVLVQYGFYLSRLVHGDLGRSIVTHEPVISEFADACSRRPSSCRFARSCLRSCLGLPAGIIAAVRRNSIFDHGVMGISLTGYSMPIFWWGLLLILLFSVQLGWTPVSGRIAVQYFVEPVTGFLLIDTLLAGDFGAFRSALSHLVLPTIVLGTVPLAVIARMTRSAMLEVLGEDYIRTARAKGLPRFRVIAIHALRNALIPVVTVIGLQVGVLFTGAILTETIFSWPGVGKWLIEGINRRDYPVLQGGTLLIGAIVMIVNLLVDVTYGLINPAHPAHKMTAEVLETPIVAAQPSAPPHPLLEFWSYFKANVGAVAGLVVIVVLVLLALFADFVAPHSPILTNNAVFLKPPFWQQGGSIAYPLGTDAIGRDILSRLIHGARLSLLIGIAVVTLSVVVGTILGLVAGFFRGVIEIAIMRLMDITLTLPSLLLAIVIVAILGPGLMNAMLAVAIVLLPHYVRIARAAVITEVSKDYVTAAKVAGAGRLRLMFKEVLPNCVGAADRAGDARHFDRDPRRGGARLSRSRCATAAAGMGNHAGGRARIRAAGLVGRDASGPRDPRHRAGLQPAGRRTARRARSQAQAIGMKPI